MLLDTFGFMPLSVLKMKRGRLDRSMFHIQKEIGRSTSQSVSEARREMPGALRLSGSGGRHNRGVGSVMAAELVAFFCRYYASEGDVYLDPFFGHGIRMQVAHRCGMHYYGKDASKRFHKYVDAVRKKIDDKTTTISLSLGDSRSADEIDDAIGDFCFTSPPYWNLEHYGDESEQLGNLSYEQFIDAMSEVAAAWHPKFKAGANVVINVSDFRKDGKFYAYHCDTVRAFESAGYTFNDIWIVEGLVSGLPRVFAGRTNAEFKQAPRVHEYALVFNT